MGRAQWRASLHGPYLRRYVNRLFIEALLGYLIVVYGCVRLCPCISSVANVGVRVSFSPLGGGTTATDSRAANDRGVAGTIQRRREGVCGVEGGTDSNDESFRRLGRPE